VKTAIVAELESDYNHDKKIKQEVELMRKNVITTSASV
jgi:hypothetical protein